MKNKYFVVVLCLILVLSNIPTLSGFATSEVVASGKCGDNTTWVFYDNGEFVVSGNGSMYNWYSWQTNSMPWIAYKSQIKSVRIEEGVTIIGERTFADCTNISTLSLPNSLTTISDYAFDECGIANLTIPNSVTHIGSYAFNRCTKLQNFVLGDNVSSIDSYAFYACSSLKNIILNTKLERVGAYAFAGCDSAEYIEIQENVNLIGLEAFISCDNLKEIKVHHNNSCYASDTNGVLYNTENNILIQYPLDNPVNSYHIADNTVEIANSAFSGCNNLVEVFLPRSLSIIRKYNFDSMFTSYKPSIIYYAGTSGEWDANVTVEERNGYTSDVICMDQVIPVTSISINKTSTLLNIDDTESLVATITPSNATNQNITWSSSDDTVATVNNGVITAIGAGTANISVTTEDGNYTATCTVTVLDNYTITYDSNGGTNTPEPQTKIQNQDINLSTDVPTRDGYTFLGWSTTSDGEVEYASGDTYSANEDVTLYAVWEEEIKDISVSGISLNKATISLNIGDSETLVATIEPSNATNQNVIWSTSDDVVAVASDGTVTAKGGGTADITVTTLDGNYSSSCTVTVIDNSSNIQTTTLKYRYREKEFSNSKTELSEPWVLYKTTYDYSHSGYTYKYLLQYEESGTGTGNGGYTSADADKWKLDQSSNYCFHGSKVSVRQYTRKTGYYTGEKIIYVTSSDNIDYTKYYLSGKYWRFSICTEKTKYNIYHYYKWGEWSEWVDTPIKATDDIEVEISGTYLITFDANGGIKAPKSQAKNYGESITLPADIPQRDGYAFLGWSATPDGEVEYNAGSTYSSDGNRTLYAIWKEIVPMLTVGNVTGKAGESVTVDIVISNNPGIAGMMLKLNYDEGLVLSDLAPSIGKENSALETLSFTKPGDLTQKPLTLPWDGMNADDTNGKVLSMTFTIPEDAENGEVYDVSISYDIGGIYDFDLNDIDFGIINGSITVKNYTLGDINNDGIFNTKDITILRRGVAGGYGVTLNESADLNNDDIFNTKDITILRRYIAGGYGVTLGQ